jgi:hypothetical protein
MPIVLGSLGYQIKQHWQTYRPKMTAALEREGHARRAFGSHWITLGERFCVMTLMNRDQKSGRESNNQTKSKMSRAALARRRAGPAPGNRAPERRSL